MGKADGLIANIVTEWKAPEEIKGPDARILTMPNIPQPLHGKGFQPRTIVSPSKWTIMRKKCYMRAGYKCQACGKDVSKKGTAHAHELFSIDYATGTSKFERLVCLCEECHVRFIHSGRMFTMLKKNSPLMTRDRVLEGIEHGFKIIKEYNDAHDEPIYPFAAFITGLEDDRIADDVAKLIEKYDMKFYGHISEKMGAARWQDWKMIFNGKEYRTIYADQDAWEQAMEEQHPEKVTNPFSGGIFDEVDKILKEGK